MSKQNKNDNINDNDMHISDDDEYINIEDFLKQEKQNIYQIQITNEKIIIKHVGIGSHAPDIIIKENFGKNNNLSLYNCVYNSAEIELLKTTIKQNNFLPIIKLIEKIDSNNKIYSLSVVLNNTFSLDETINDFDLYFTCSINNEYIEYYKLEKNINSSNIVEKILEMIIDLGNPIL